MGAKRSKRRMGAEFEGESDGVASASGTCSPVPKNISSGVWPSNAE